MTNLHIGYVLKMYPRLSETFIVNEILELERRGVRVTVFSLRPPKDGRFHAKLARVRAEVVYLPDVTPGDLLGLLVENREAFEPVRHRLAGAFWDLVRRGASRDLKLLGKAAFLALRLRESDVGHLHAHFGTSASETARLVSRITGIPYSFTAHAKDIYHEKVEPEALQARIDEARFVVTVCDANRAFLRERLPSKTAVHRIYNGLDLTEFRPAPAKRDGCFRILTVSRLVPKKGLDTLIEACTVLKKRGVDFRCTVVGDGPERPALEEMIEKGNAGDVVSLAGPLPDSRVRQAMSAADLFVLPARIAADGNRDALPTVLLEALAVGLPVLSTPVGGIAEILDDGAAGDLVPSDRSDLLAGSLERLVSDGEKRERMSRAGIKRVREMFDVGKNVSELVALFDESVRRGGNHDGETGEGPAEVRYASGLS